MRHHHHHHHSRGPGIAPGILFISLGGALLLREFGYLPPGIRVIDFWPLILIAFGISGTFRKVGALRRAMSFGVFMLGGIFLASNLGYLAFPAARLWPLVFILFGVGMLFRRRCFDGGMGPGPFGPRGRFRDRIAGSDVNPSTGGDHFPFQGQGQGGIEEKLSDDRLSREVTLSGAQIRVDSQAWQGGELAATFAGVELDLRHAKLHEDGATLGVRVSMGGIEIRVPDTWLVTCDVHPFLGGVDNDTRVPQGSPNPPKLRIVGSVTVGGVNVRT
jgi:Domain of unknown function (DUF5668)/Cell wall-active antibiotics response 4TMS YvqF